MMKILKNNSYDEIKKEILEGGVDSWMDKEENLPKEFSISTADFEVRRQNEKILKEFGW